MIFGSDDERENFIKSVGDLPVLDSLRIYLQGSKVSPEDMIPGTISAFADIPRTQFPKTTPIVEQIYTTRKLENAELDDTFPENPTVIIKDQYNQIIACVDQNGIIHMCDFYHCGRPFGKEFEKILTITSKYIADLKSTIVKQVINTLQEIDADRIEKIVITTSFDKEAYIRNAERIIEEAIKSIESIKEMQINAIVAAKEKQIKMLEDEIKYARASSIATVIKLFNDPAMKKWKVNGDRLEHTEPIYVTKIKKYDTIYPDNSKKMFIEGLSIRIVPEIYQEDVEFKAAFHPNCSDNYICLGDLAGADILKVIKELPEMLSTANLDSHYSNEAAKYATNRIYEIPADAPAETVWNDENWEA